MTVQEHALWSACYAAAWFHAPSSIIAGLITDADRAANAATHADRMVKALRVVRGEVIDGE